MRLDRLSMAHAIVEGELYWSFKGIEDFRPSSRNADYRSRSLNALAQTLLDSSNYMDAQRDSEVEYYLSDDCDADWREECEHRAHDRHCCSSEGCEAYKAALEAMFRDQQERSQWAYDRIDFDFDFLRSNIIDNTGDVFWVAWFLKDHPVEGVMTREGEYLSLDEVKGYCQCGEPIDETCFDKFSHGPDVKAHPMRPGCNDCDVSHVNGATCGFEHDGAARLIMECPRCGDMFATDQLEESHLGLFKRPFNWPAEAPYPPRFSFDLRPMEAPPEELETY